ncbi:DUF4153 domain-containing protein [Pedobacter mucosus]|uniref:DUF4153 domain-containing protein n=1 Tax=Pedobacter mucosus TaxID=2895286 RepID=UPI001EE4928E|nr:DUF4173 domain-containing protein [Pedobacter mucosus]UKT66088.1 DUF4173 domain-containing protein [Pedobacter mucosus]
MKNKSNLLLLSAIIGGLLFNYLFWNEGTGVNLLVYSIYLLLITAINYKVLNTSKFKIYGSAHLLVAILVVINNSDLSIVAYYISLLLFIGYSHNQQIRTVFTAFGAAMLQMITAPLNGLKNLSEVTIGNFSLKPVFKIIKYIFIPVVIVIIFTCLYSAASSVFAHYADALLTNIFNFLNHIFGFLFKDLSIERAVFFVLGLVISSGLLLTFFDKTLEQTELKCKEQLLRIRRSDQQKNIVYIIIHVFSGTLLNKKLALKTENINGIISFSALNALLLLLNIIDVTTLWFGYKPSQSLSADLHDGTNALIASIIIALIVIVYFFRGNLNFYSKSKMLKTLAFAWMIQNCILIISVLIRDAFYIEFYGLTHKRIGVIVFAILCIVGLATVYWKVAKQQTLFYLFKINGTVWFALLLAFSSINWDVLIAKYNLNNDDSVAIDADYLLSLSDKTLLILDKNRLKLQYSVSKNYLERETPKPQTAAIYQKRLDKRIAFFKDRYEKVSWVSWNLQDWKTAEYFRLEK